CQLTQLRKLDVSNNQLTTLAEPLSQLTLLRELNVSRNQLPVLPEWLSELTQLEVLGVSGLGLSELNESIGSLQGLTTLWLQANQIQALPRAFVNLSNLQLLNLGDGTGGNPLLEFPEAIRYLKNLKGLWMGSCGLQTLPDWLDELHNLRTIHVYNNHLTDVPLSLGRLSRLERLNLKNNPLNPELAGAHNEGYAAVIRYLRAKAEAQVVLNEAKLILIGEGEVGKSCLLGALRGDDWIDGRDTTHGIEIKPVKVTDPDRGTEITLNGWDFGGQRVYRPTHQLFFSSPAVYLVVWKPREGPQQGFVKDWIKLVKHREPDAKILVVATHGGPKERQPDIDRQEIWDLFDKETVIDFLHVDSQPPDLDEKTGRRIGECTGIKELRDAITRVAASLPEMGRTFPKHWQEAREALRRSTEAYLPLDRVFAICKEHEVEEDDARLLLRICHHVGDLIHYEHDPALRDIVVLKPDLLATAISFVLDDKETRDVGHGLVKLDRLETLWNDPERPEENRYPTVLHALFLRLMERFDLSYRIAERDGANGTSLIAQLVPDVRPEDALAGVWTQIPSAGDEQQVQICRIVETANNQSATAEGLFFQLIVRLHRYSLGRADFGKSVHWQRGLVLEDDTGARAFLEHVGNDVRITVRSPYPPSFLGALTYEAKWLVESFWKGMRCEVTVPCLVPMANGEPCKGLFEVGKLLENKKRGRPEQPCAICNEWQSVEQLLGNAPAAHPDPMLELMANFAGVKLTLEAVRAQIGGQHTEVIGRFDQVDAASREAASKVEAAYSGLMRTLLDEAKEGPRLFSFEPVEPGFFDRPKWVSAKFNLTLWCEHSRVPVWQLSDDPKKGVYTIDLPREWLVKAAPFLKVLTSTLGLMLPVVAASAKVGLPEVDYKGIEAELALGKASAESLLKGSEKMREWLGKNDNLELSSGATIRAEGAVLRQLHSWLKEKDPSFGGLVRVQNKRQEFLWVHPKFETEY
ncbi:MAG: COR domain-containing protein, partial [Pyrinomonadaceae bacterium]